MSKRYPFKFLDAYTREDQDIFFGREEEVASLYKMVFQTDLILIYGASGTGKTSLIQCGLAGKFQSHDWLDLQIRRGNNLNTSLEKVLAAAGGNLEEAEDDLDWLDEDWAEDSASSLTSQSPLAKRLKAIYLKHFKPIYLIFDQFEELYILGDYSEQETFVATVKELLQVEQPVKLILSIREEYLGYLYEFEKAVPELLRKKLRIEPMNLDKVKTVVQSIGKAKGSLVQLKAGEEGAIAEQIFEKIKGKEKKLSIPLPYLQVFLDKFYLKTTQDESRTTEATFSLEGMAGMQDIDNVLRDFLDEQVIQTAQDVAQSPDLIWQILSPFVTLEGTKEPLSLINLHRRFQDLPLSLLTRILKVFDKSRILRYSEESQLYEIAHDSLALQIHDKRSTEETTILEIQRLVKSQMVLKEDARAFLPEFQLELVDLYRDRLLLNKAEEDYLAACRAEVDRQNREKRRRYFLPFGVVVFFVMTGLTIYALNAQNQAKVQEKKAMEALATIKLNQKIKVAEELKIYGVSYLDLGKDNAALEVFQAALDSLGAENKDLPIYLSLAELIETIQ